MEQIILEGYDYLNTKQILD